MYSGKIGKGDGQHKKFQLFSVFKDIANANPNIKESYMVSKGFKGASGKVVAQLGQQEVEER